MEQLEQLVDEYWPKIKEFVLGLEPMHWGILGGVILLLIIIFRIAASSGRKKKAKKFAPNLLLHAYQVAPLGRDAYLKIKNTGHPATLSSLLVKGRHDIIIKNAVAGHQIESDKVYGILLEANDRAKIGTGFSMEITYLDTQGNVYQQSFLLDQQTAKQPKLIKYS